jgi:hypothetical protein
VIEAPRARSTADVHLFVQCLVAAALAAPSGKAAKKPASKVVLSQIVPGKPAKEAKVSKAKRRPHRPPLSGEAKAEKVKTIAAAIGSSGLIIARVHSVSAIAVSDGVGIDIGPATMIRDESSTAAPLALVDGHGRVGMRLPARVGGVYMFDCGVSGARDFRFNVLENGANFASGTTAAGLDRLIFAHVFTHDADTRLLVNFAPVEPDEEFRFSGCEITELIPASQATHGSPATEAATSF